MFNWMNENEKIALMGDFNQSYWSEKYPQALTKIVFADPKRVPSDTSEYLLTFTASKKKSTVTFFYDSHTEIEIEIKNDSADACADRIIHCCCGLIAMDLYDLKKVLSSDREPAVYYGALGLNEAKQLQMRYRSKAGRYVVIHAPKSDLLGDAEMFFEEIAKLCDQRSDIFWNLYIEDVNEYVFDLFFGGKELSDG